MHNMIKQSSPNPVESEGQPSSTTTTNTSDETQLTFDFINTTHTYE